MIDLVLFAPELVVPIVVAVVLAVAVDVSVPAVVPAVPAVPHTRLHPLPSLDE